MDTTKYQDEPFSISQNWESLNEGNLNTAWPLKQGCDGMSARWKTMEHSIIAQVWNDLTSEYDGKPPRQTVLHAIWDTTSAVSEQWRLSQPDAVARPSRTWAASDTQRAVLRLQCHDYMGSFEDYDQSLKCKYGWNRR